MKRLSYIGLGICHPYQLDDSTCHLRTVLFHFDFISNITSCKRTVVPDQTPRSSNRVLKNAVSDLDLLCFLMSLFWDTGYIWFYTIIFYCISCNHRHVFPREISQPASFKLLSYFCSAKRNRNKVSEFAYQIGQFTGIQGLPGSAFQGCI